MQILQLIITQTLMQREQAKVGLGKFPWRSASKCEEASCRNGNCCLRGPSWAEATETVTSRWGTLEGGHDVGVSLKGRLGRH